MLNKKMKVVLLKNVPKLGLIGEVKEVSAGYAQNFLISKKLALPATEKSINQVQSSQKKEANKASMALEKAEKLSAQIEGIELFIKGKSNKQGTLFAAIGEKEVCSSLKKKGINVNIKHIKLSKHIKEVGEHDIMVGLDHGLEAKIKIIVE